MAILEGDKTTSLERLVVSVDISCLSCDATKTKTYDPGIVYSDFIGEKPKLICDNCNSVSLSIPHFSDELTSEEWRSELIEKYWTLKKTADDNFLGLWFSLEFQLTVKTILNIKNLTLPFIGIILGRPGSQKTLGIDQVC